MDRSTTNHIPYESNDMSRITGSGHGKVREKQGEIELAPQRKRNERCHGAPEGPWFNQRIMGIWNLPSGYLT